MTGIKNHTCLSSGELLGLLRKTVGKRNQDIQRKHPPSTEKSDDGTKIK